MRGRHAGREIVRLDIEADAKGVITGGWLCTHKGGWEIDCHRVSLLAVINEGAVLLRACRSYVRAGGATVYARMH